MSKRIAIVLVAGGVVAATWIGSGGLSGRGFGFGGDGDCKVTSGRSSDGVAEAQARCTWPIPADRLQALLAAWDDQDRFFSNLAESTVLERGDQRMLVRQIQRASGISDREVVIECTSETIPGGRRYRWRKAPDQSRNSGRNVEVAVHEGFWQITRKGEQESVVEYQLRYEPGGNVPSFLLSMFMSSGMEGVLGELRQAAETSSVAARNSGAGG